MSKDFDLLNSEIKEGLTVIESSAGTGKTFTISRLVPRFLLENKDLRLGQILLVTFTNDATAELAGRVRMVLEELYQAAVGMVSVVDSYYGGLIEQHGRDKVKKVVLRAILEADQLAVMTIHSFCARVLQVEGMLCGLPVMPEIVPSEGELMREILHRIWEEKVSNDNSLIAFASVGEMNYEKDLEFVRAALKERNVEFKPNKEDLGLLKDKIENLRKGKKEEGQKSFLELCRKIRDGNFCKNEFPSIEEISEKIQNFSKSWGEFLEAVDVVVGRIPEGINQRTKEGKDLFEEVKGSELFSSWKDVPLLVKRFCWSWRIELVEEVRKRLDDLGHTRRAISYDGLVEKVHEALIGENGELLVNSLRNEYALALIDEAQDTDQRQFEIFEKIFRDCPLVLIGDPKQAIYRFRGADVNTYLRAKKDAVHYQLTTTYRSPQKLVEAVNAVFGSPKAFLKEGLEYSPNKSGLQQDVWLAEKKGENFAPECRMEAWFFAPEMTKTSEERQDVICGAVALKIASLLANKAEIVEMGSRGQELSRREVRASDFAVLVNQHAQAERMIERLIELGVPAYPGRGGNIFETEEASELLIVLKAVEEPQNRKKVRTARITRLLGGKFDELDESEAAEADAMHFLEWNALWLREGLAAVLSRMETEKQICCRLAQEKRGERRVANFRQLCDLLLKGEGEVGAEPARVLRWLRDKIAQESREGGPAEEFQLQLESEREAVRVMTMHAVKGLEFPLVFCPFLWDGREPNGLQKLRDAEGGVVMVDLGMTKWEEKNENLDLGILAKRQYLEERIRLAYVALTRAKVKVWFVAGIQGQKNSKVGVSALDWLLCSLRKEEEEKVTKEDLHKRDLHESNKHKEVTNEEFQRWYVSFNQDQRYDLHKRALCKLKEHVNIVDVVEDPEGQVVAVKREEAKVAPEQPPAVPAVPVAWGLTSFSQLTRERHRFSDATPLELRGGGAGWGELRAAEGGEDFQQVPGGTLFGQAVHEFLETWDFQELDEENLKNHIRKYPLRSDGTDWVLEFKKSLENLPRAVLPGFGVSVGEVCGANSGAEWHFLQPLLGKFSVGRLANAFEMCGETEYAKSLRMLPFAELEGFFEGIIDRIVFHNGQWGLIDWKTNWLGLSAGDYSEERLRECALQNHYVLQMNLYLVALRRFLRLCKPDAKLAGAWLVFLRGVERGRSQGILHIPVNEKLLRELEKLFSEQNL